ncbi:hypothetical protein ACWD48_36635 [Streptomyces sp. NPDC002519]
MPSPTPPGVLGESSARGARAVARSGSTEAAVRLLVDVRRPPVTYAAAAACLGPGLALAVLSRAMVR